MYVCTYAIHHAGVFRTAQWLLVFLSSVDTAMGIGVVERYSFCSTVTICTKQLQTH